MSQPITRTILLDNIKRIKREMDQFELDPDDYEKEFQQRIREQYKDVNVCGLTLDVITILENCDEDYYNQMLNDYVEIVDKERDPNYKDLESELADAEQELADFDEEDRAMSDPTET